ncbi:TCR/Tet family MFS transporter [Pararhodobacter sp.]|uniref:TCR/Tet family MFS transporter n=1 Tax=Pararhodobacter sp. TaxID=2127056 RepID=UPI002AFE0384|nr:TCR/Tet family MFS transporter [Pararhodobacter sp.]
MQNRAAIFFILITLTLDAIGFGLIMPVMPDLLRAVTGGDLASAALWGGALVGGFAVMQFLFGPVIGNLSDRFGRRPVLLVSLAVLSADYVVLALAGSVWLIFATRLVIGAASSTYGTSMAYISDISTPKEKAQRFGLVGAAFGTGFVLGPAIGGMLAEYGVRAPFVAAAVVSGLNMLFGVLVLRESLSAEHRRPFELRRANPFGAFKHIGKLPGLGRYLTIYTVHEFGFAVYPVIWAYFTIARFGWTPGQVGLSLAFYGVGFALVQGVLIRVVIARLGRRAAMFIGFIAGFASFSTLIWLESGVLALVMIPISALSGLVMPALRAEMSDMVSSSQQGELQGALASLHAVGMIVSPFVYTWTFALFTGEDALWFLPGAVFAIPAALNVVSFVLLRNTKKRKAP